MTIFFLPVTFVHGLNYVTVHDRQIEPNEPLYNSAKVVIGTLLQLIKRNPYGQKSQVIDAHGAIYGAADNTNNDVYADYDDDDDGPPLKGGRKSKKGKSKRSKRSKRINKSIRR